MQRLFVATRGDETHLALCDDERLVEYAIERPGRPNRIGSIYRGRIARVDPGLGAAFVEIGLDRPGFLPLSDALGKPEEGRQAILQVVREERGSKGARLTGHPRLAGIYLVFAPIGSGIFLSGRIEQPEIRRRLSDEVARLANPGEGWIVRRAAADAATAEVAAEAASLRSLWNAIGQKAERGSVPGELHRDDDGAFRLVRDAGGRVGEIVFDTAAAAEQARRAWQPLHPEIASRVRHRAPREWVPGWDEIGEQVDAALDRRVPFASGGSLLFEAGETLTAIDVDSGGIAGRIAARDPERTFLEVDLAAAAEIGRQLRLRNLGGIIVIDFIDLKVEAHRRQVVEALTRAVAADPAQCRIEPMSSLGLVAMTRRRRGPSLSEALTLACPTCGGVGRVPLRGGSASGGARAADDGSDDESA